MSESLQTLIKLVSAALDSEADAFRTRRWKEREIAEGEFESLRSWLIQHNAMPAAELNLRVLQPVAHEYSLAKTGLRIEGTGASLDRLKKARVALSQTLLAVREDEHAKAMNANPQHQLTLSMEAR